MKNVLHIKKEEISRASKYYGERDLQKQEFLGPVKGIRSAGCLALATYLASGWGQQTMGHGPNPLAACFCKYIWSVRSSVEKMRQRQYGPRS